MQTLSNQKIAIAVKEHGAELCSLRSNGREYLWQADKKYWARHSPVLFPFVGSVWNGEFRAHGQVYEMGQHGFARDMDFELVSQTDKSLTYRLVSSDETRARYPYDFELEIGYELYDDHVRVLWLVRNVGREVLPFQIGAHPAFYWPMLTDQEIAAGLEAMEASLASTDERGYIKLSPAARVMPISKVTEKGCIGATASVELDDDGYLVADIPTFDHDALVFEDTGIRRVTICDNDKRPYLTVEFTSPLVGIWSPPGKRAPFVCIEPWYGRADTAGFEGDITQKKWIQTLDPGCEFHASYDIVIEQ